MKRKLIVVTLVMLTAFGFAAYANGQVETSFEPIAPTEQAQAARELPLGTPVSGDLGRGEEWFSIRITGDGSLTVEVTGNDDAILGAYSYESRRLIAEGDGTPMLQIDVYADRTYLFCVAGRYSRDNRGPFTIMARWSAGSAAR